MGVGICCQQCLIIFIHYFFSFVLFSTIFSIITPINTLVNPNKFIYEVRERAGLAEETKMVNKRSQQRGLNKGAWTAEEDQKLVKCVIAHGEKQWRTLPALAGTFLYSRHFIIYMYFINLFMYFYRVLHNG